MFTVKYVNRPNVTESYEMPFDFVAFSGSFHTLLKTIHAWSFVFPPNFHSLCIK